MEGCSYKCGEKAINFFEIPNMIPICVDAIFDFIDEDSLFHIGKTCKIARNEVSRYFGDNFEKIYLPDFEKAQKVEATKTRPKPKKITGLYYAQVKGMVALEKNKNKNLFLHAPMGSGKTMLMLMHATKRWKKDGVRTIIVGTNASFTTWWEHLSICGLNVTKSNVEKSDVIVLHSTCSAHRKYILNTDPSEYVGKKTITVKEMVGGKKVDKKVEVDKPYIIIVVDRYIKSKSNNTLSALKRLNEVFTETVADEAHLIFRDNHQSHLDFFRHFKRNVYLSATDFSSEYKYRSYDGETCDGEVYDKRISLCHTFDHPVEMRYEMVPQLNNDSDRLAEQIGDLLMSDVFKSRHNKIVLFCNWNDRWIRHYTDSLNKRVPGYQFELFNNKNMRALNLFNKAGVKMVLVTTVLKASEGTNFEQADAGIYVDFGNREIKRARQAFGRICRRSNPNSVIYNYVLYDNKDTVAYIRTMLNVYYAVDLTLNIGKKSTSDVLPIAKACAREGIDIKKMPKPEFITLFGVNMSKSFLPYKESDYTISAFKLVQLMTVGIGDV